MTNLDRLRELSGVLEAALESEQGSSGVSRDEILNVIASLQLKVDFKKHNRNQGVIGVSLIDPETNTVLLKSTDYVVLG